MPSRLKLCARLSDGEAKEFGVLRAPLPLFAARRGDGISIENWSLDN